MSSFKLKVLLCGAGAVGKTSLIRRFIKGEFQREYKLTVGVDILTKEVEVDGNITTLSIWDIGGQARFEFIRSSFYKGAAGALIVFDLLRSITFEEVNKWYNEIRNFTQDIPFILIGNKLDLLDDIGEVIDRNEARHFAETRSSIYIETSAKNGTNVEEAFKGLTRRIINQRGWQVIEPTIKPTIKPPIKYEFEESVQIDQDLIDKKVDMILCSKPNKVEDFRFLILGNADAQKPFLKHLFQVEEITWPPKEPNILYGTTKYDFKSGLKKYNFEIFIMSDLYKIKNKKSLFEEACKEADAILVYVDASNEDEFDLSVNTCIELKEKIPNLEIVMIWNLEASTPIMIRKRRELKHVYSIQAASDFSEATMKILGPLLEKKEEKQYQAEELREIFNTLMKEVEDPRNVDKAKEMLFDAAKKFGADAGEIKKISPKPEAAKIFSEEKAEAVSASQMNLRTHYEVGTDRFRILFNPTVGLEEKKTVDAQVSRQFLDLIQEDINEVYAYCQDIQRGGKKDDSGVLEIQEPSEDVFSEIVGDTTREKLETIGKQIFQMLLPQKIKEYLTDYSVNTIVINSEKFMIPFELIHDGEDFLAKKIEFYRKPIMESKKVLKVTEKAREMPFQAVFFTNPTKDLKNAEEETAKIIKYFNSIEMNKKIENYQGDGANYKALRKIFFSPRLDIFHYSGHSDVEEDDISFRLSEGKFPVTDVALQHPALFFLNSCESGKTVEQKREFTGLVTLNFPLAIMSQGAKGCVATLWPIRDKPAAKFANEFYEQLLRGESFGSAIRKAKNKLAKESDPSDITWMSFILYGDPNQAKLI